MKIFSSKKLFLDNDIMASNGVSFLEKNQKEVVVAFFFIEKPTFVDRNERIKRKP